VGPKANFCGVYAGHQNAKSYARYDRTREAKVRAAQRCAADSSLTYVEALRQETSGLKAKMVEGDTSTPPGSTVRTAECSDSPAYALRDITNEESPSKRLKNSKAARKLDGMYPYALSLIQ
jgi:hypothetical protein